jgi:sirohydrochlorin ferrochelatase
MSDHLLIAHGSPDPRHAATMSRVAQEVNDRGITCELAYLEHNEPTADQWLSARGRSQTVKDPVAVTGLFLAPGYHAQVDVPRLLASAAPALTIDDRGPLGVGPWLEPTLDDLVARSGGTPATPVIVTAAGSSRDDARGYLADFVAQWGSTRPGSVAFAVATGPGPAVAEALATARSRNDNTIVLLLMIAPGVLADRVVDLSNEVGVRVSGTLADSPVFVDALIGRLAD